MAEDTTPSPSEPSPKGKKGKLLIVGGVLVLPLAWFGANTFLLGSKHAAAEKHGAESIEKTAGGEIVSVEPMSINLSDGHYLKVGVAIELAEGEPAKEFEKKGKPNKIRDAVIMIASTRSMAELGTPEGKQEFRDALHEKAERLYGESYHGLYLTEFVMQ